jgi:N-acetylmuramoyl-L-alanine amidase
MQDLRFYVFLKYGLFCILFLLTTLSYSSPNPLTDQNKIVIVIDPGHGGKDIGTSGAYLIEKDATLTLALELGKTLTQMNPNVEVRFTRETDLFVPIHKRVSYANHNKADLFISVHCNAVRMESPHGIETYVLGVQNNQENLETVKRENESILHEKNFKENYDGFDPDSPSGHIYLSAVQNQYMNEGILLAHQIQTQFSDQKVMRDRGVKQASFVVLKKATMPAILLEVGFLSNKRDESKLRNDNTRKTIVNHISEGINQYVVELQKIDHPLVTTDIPQTLNNNPLPIEKKDKKQPRETFDIVLASSANGELSHMPTSVVDNKSVKSHYEGGTYTYLIGPYFTLFEAIEKQNELRSGDYKGAYVVKSKMNTSTASSSGDIQIKYAGVN